MYAEAAEEANKAIHFKKDFVKAYCRGAEAYCKGGKYARAIEKLLEIPDECLPLDVGNKTGKAEQETLDNLLKDSAVLPSTPSGNLQVGFFAFVEGLIINKN